MFGLGGNNPARRGPIGIAVTAGEVYLAQRDARDGERFAVQPLAEGTDPAGASYHTETARAIASALRRSQFTGKNAVSALPAEAYLCKTLRLPPMPEEDLVQAVAWEAAERYQLGEEQSLQYYNAGQVQQGSETRQEIILLSGERATIQDHALAVKRAGLIPLAIDATGAALARCLGSDVGSSFIVHLHQASCEIIGAQGTGVIFNKPIGVTRLNDELDTAALSRELSLCLRYLSVTFGIHRPEAAWISGLGVSPQLVSDLNESLPTTLQHVSQSAILRKISFPGTDPSPWLVPLGLAMRDRDHGTARGAA